MDARASLHTKVKGRSESHTTEGRNRAVLDLTLFLFLSIHKEISEVQKDSVIAWNQSTYSLMCSFIETVLGAMNKAVIKTD